MVKSDAINSSMALDFLLLREKCPNRKTENRAAHTGIKASDMSSGGRKTQP